MAPSSSRAVEPASAEVEHIESQNVTDSPELVVVTPGTSASNTPSSDEEDVDEGIDIYYSDDGESDYHIDLRSQEATAYALLVGVSKSS